MSYQKFSLTTISTLALILLLAGVLAGSLISLSVNRDREKALINEVTKSIDSGFGDVVELLVKQKARDVAMQVRLYAEASRELDFQDPDLRDIAIQPIEDQKIDEGAGSYTCVFSRTTTEMFAHPSPDYDGRIMSQFANQKGLEAWWRIFSESLSSGSAEGNYSWLDNGKRRKKFMFITPVAPGHDLLVAATQYRDTFSAHTGLVNRNLETMLTANRRRISIDLLVVLAVFALATVLFQYVAYRKLQAFLREVKQFSNHLGLENYRNAPSLPVSSISEVEKVFESLEVLRARLNDSDVAYRQEAKWIEAHRITRRTVHELKSPIEKLKICIRELESSDSASTTAVTDLLRDTNSGLTELIDEILKPRDNFLTSIERFDLTTRLEEWTRGLRAAYSIIQPEIEFTFQSPGVEQPIIGSRKNLERVFTNLVRNAVQSIDGPGVVRVILSITPEGALVSVADTGKGISPDYVHKIFTDGFTWGKKEEGHGLGLFFCQQVVSEHGGDIFVAETSPSGSTFHIRLPIPDPAAAGTGSSGTGSSDSVLRLQKGKKLLVIDDKTSALARWFQAAAQHDFEGNYCESFEKVEAEIQWQDFPETHGLVIVDHVFSNSQFSGIDICKTLLERTGGAVPCIIFTVNPASPELRSYCEHSGIPVWGKDHFDDLIGLVFGGREPDSPPPVPEDPPDAMAP